MQRSTSHILTTHTGSLPRTPVLQELLRLREERQPYDQATMEAGLRSGVAEIVQGVVHRWIARRQGDKQRGAADRQKYARLDQEREPFR